MRELRRVDVWINNESIRQVDPRIINVRVIEPDATENIAYADLTGRPGRIVTRQNRTSKKIQVQFAIRELFDLARRTEIIDAVNRWARDGVLMVSTRPERMAQVIVTRYASAADVREYTGVYTVEFEAAGVPYWQDAEPQTLTVTGTSSSGAITIPGSAETVLDAKIVPLGTMTTLMITVTDAQSTVRSMSFTGLSARTQVSIWHDERGILRMSSGMMGHRTAESDDELFAEPGVATVQVEANVSCRTVITARGRYR